MDPSSLDSLDSLINDQVQNAIAFWSVSRGNTVPQPTALQVQTTPPPITSQLADAAFSDPWSVAVIAAVIVGAVLVIKAVR
jgi:hypothetical protein